MCEPQKEEIEVTPEMIEAGFDALVRSGVLQSWCEGDKFAVEIVFNAILAASSFAPKSLSGADVAR